MPAGGHGEKTAGQTQVVPPPVPALPQARVQPPPPLLSAGAEVSLAPDQAEFPGKVMARVYTWKGT